MAVSQIPTNGGVNPTFQLQDVTVKHNGRAVLEHITVDIPRGGVTAVVGPSGAGKSTMLRILNRFEDPSQGRVTFAGAPMSSHDPALLRRRVGLLSQRPVALAECVADDLRVGAADLSDSDVTQLLSRVDLAELSLGQGTAGLSGGELQRLALARALAVEPSVLLLDEPTSALDSEAAGAVDQVARDLVDQGGTVVVVSHDLDRVRRIASHVVVLRRGRLVEHGSPQELGYSDVDKGNVDG